MCNLKNRWHKDKSQTFKYADCPSDINSVAGWLKKTSLKRKATWKPFITTPWTLDKRIMFYLANNLSDNWLDNILKRPLWRRGCCLHTAQNYQYQTSGWYSAAYITHPVGLSNLWLEEKKRDPFKIGDGNSSPGGNAALLTSPWDVATEAPSPLWGADFRSSKGRPDLNPIARK